VQPLRLPAAVDQALEEVAILHDRALGGTRCRVGLRGLGCLMGVEMAYECNDHQFHRHMLPPAQSPHGHVGPRLGYLAGSHLAESVSDVERAGPVRSGLSRRSAGGRAPRVSFGHFASLRPPGGRAVPASGSGRRGD
jgi:hypothetical protein